jgi:hypothetical protein
MARSPYDDTCLSVERSRHYRRPRTHCSPYWAPLQKQLALDQRWWAVALRGAGARRRAASQPHRAVLEEAFDANGRAADELPERGIDGAELAGAARAVEADGYLTDDRR